MMNTKILQNTKGIVFGLLRQGLMISMVIISLLPVYFILVTALKNKSEYVFNKWGLPASPTLQNFLTLLEGEKIFRWLLNSTLISISSVFVCVILSSLMAFAFSRYTFPGKSALFTGITSLLVLSPVVLVIPLFRTMVSLNLHNTYLSVIIVYVGVMIPISTYLLTSFFRSIPQAIVDASIVDGCSEFQIYKDIIMPLSMPAVITTVLTNWLYIWNEILISLVFLQNDNLRTLMSGLSLFKGKYTTDIPLTMSGVAVAIIPTLVLYLIGQRYFVRGLTTGAVK